ncbi:hypothetical protein ACFL5M_04115 [Candidatus Neomarinimicrobiota bacterium]
MSKKQTTIENMKTRLLKEHLGKVRVFVDTPTVANLLGISEAKVDSIMKNGTITYVMIDGAPLIPIITLLDEMEWFPSEVYAAAHLTDEVSQ